MAGKDNVFANGRAILHAGSSGKSMSAFPDVCLCPPPSPAGPIPTPLPNNALAKDLDGCAQAVFIHDDPCAIETSFVARSTGNEVSKPTGGGVVSHAVQGKAYFASHSMNVLVEGKGVVRHMDIVTHNHNSTPGNTPPWPFLSKAAAPKAKAMGPCRGNAKACRLRPYKKGCPPGKTAHHVLPQHLFVKAGMRAANEKGLPDTCVPGCGRYKSKNAPCVCVTGASFVSKSRPSGRLLQHGRVHKRFDVAEAVAAKTGGWDYEQAAEAAAKSIVEVVRGCSKDCIRAQLDAYHKRTCRVEPKTRLRARVRDKEVGAEADKVIKKFKLPETSL